MSVIDISELVTLAADLSSAAARVSPEIMASTSKGALLIKQRLQEEAQGIRHAPGLPASINYDIRTGNGWVEAQIGPREGGAGSLAFFYYGNSKIGPQLPDPMIALEAEGEVFAQQLTRILSEGMLP